MQPIGPDTLIDISHEALIRCWRKIADEEGRLAAARVPGRTDLGVSSDPGWQVRREQRAGPVAGRDRVPAIAWLKTLPNKSWAERYGGDWQDVQELMAASREEAKRQRELETERRREAERKRKRRGTGRSTGKGRPAAGVSFGCARLGHGAGRIAGVYVAAATACQETQAAEHQRQLAETQLAPERQHGQRRRPRAADRTSCSSRSLTHAALLADGEDYARARGVLEESRKLDGQIALERRHARDFLARYVDIMGGGAQQVYEGAGVPVLAVAVSPEGDLLAAVGRERHRGAVRRRERRDPSAARGAHRERAGMLPSIQRAAGW